MPHGIGNRFLTNSKQRVGETHWNGPGFAVLRYGDRNRTFANDGMGSLLECLCQSQALEVARPQCGDVAPCFHVPKAHQVQSRFELITQSASGRCIIA